MSRLFLPAGKNYCTHPSFELDANANNIADGWGTSHTVTGSPTYSLPAGRTGGVCQRVQYTGEAGDASKRLRFTSALTGVGTFAPDEPCTISAYIKGALVGCTLKLTINYYNAAGALISSLNGQNIEPTADWVRYEHTKAYLPANTSQIMMWITTSSDIDTGDTVDLYIDDVQIEKATYATPYFDGDSDDCSWDGTTDASASTRVASVLSFAAGDYAIDDEGTVGFAFTPLWGCGDAAGVHDQGRAHQLFALRDAGDSADALVVYKHTDETICATLAGAGTKTVATAALDFEAGSEHAVCVRWRNGDETGPELALCFDGQMADPVANDQTVTVGEVDVGRGATEPGMAYMGGVLVSPHAKTDAEMTQLSRAANYAAPSRDIWARMGEDDLYVKLGNTTHAYQRLTAGATLAAAGQLVCDGNSLTTGLYSTFGADYPRQLLALMDPGWVLRNYAVSGQTTQQMTADGVAQVDAMYDATAYPLNLLFAWEIHNDIISNSLTGAQAYANYVTYCEARQAAGWTVYAFTALHSTEGGSVPAGFNDEVDAANVLIRAGWSTFADKLVDVAADARLADPSDTDYFAADGIHLVDAGAAVVAALAFAQMA